MTRFARPGTTIPFPASIPSTPTRATGFAAITPRRKSRERALPARVANSDSVAPGAEGGHGDAAAPQLLGEAHRQ